GARASCPGGYDLEHLQGQAKDLVNLVRPHVLISRGEPVMGHVTEQSNSAFCISDAMLLLTPQCSAMAGSRSFGRMRRADCRIPTVAGGMLTGNSFQC